MSQLTIRQAATDALRNLAPDHPTVRIWGRLEGSAPEHAQEGNSWAADPQDVADVVLAAITDRLRDEIGPSDCSCGGCDSCVQHALVDWLDPR
ncbi:hypothetical protein [Streptomyces sp. NPDC016626]|uniref:hypothetical protein n=1 Tax=Streptomyces sp. NPDC016626 TaxID=3364968 RepID=UPI0036F8404C